MGEGTLRDQIKYLENQKRELEDEVSRLKNAQKDLRVQTERELSETTRRIRTEEVRDEADSISSALRQTDLIIRK